MPPKSSPNLSVFLRPYLSLNWNNPRRRCSIRPILSTLGGAMITPSKGLSPGIAPNLD
jgi:hypothetical protein